MKNTKLTDQELKLISHRFFSSLGNISDDYSLLLLFFTVLLSPSEYRDILLRWEILRLLSRRTDQREISARLGVSMTKITRASLALFHHRHALGKVQHRIRFV